MDPDEIVECYQAFSLMEAKFIADELNSEGIKARSDSMDMQDALGPMSGNPRIYVRAGDLARAQKWLLDYEERKKTHNLLEP